MKQNQQQNYKISCLTKIRKDFTLTDRNTINLRLFLLIILSTIAICYGIFVLTLPVNRKISIPNYSASSSTANAVVPFEVANDLHGRIAVFYILDNFEVERDYKDSKNKKQLHGETISIGQAGKCAPYITNKDMNVTQSWAGAPLDPNAVASPCGKQAYLYFQDKIVIKNQQGAKISLGEETPKTSYKRAVDSKLTQWVDPESNRFETWMSFSLTTTVYKKYGIIEGGLKAGSYTLEIEQNSKYADTVRKSIEIVEFNHNFGDNYVIGVWLVVAGGTLLLFGGSYHLFLKSLIHT